MKYGGWTNKTVVRKILRLDFPIDSEKLCSLGSDMAVWRSQLSFGGSQESVQSSKPPVSSTRDKAFGLHVDLCLSLFC